MKFIFLHAHDDFTPKYIYITDTFLENYDTY